MRYVLALDQGTTSSRAIAFDEQGRVVDDLQDPKGAYPETTSATEADGKLFIQSLHARSLAWLPYSGK